MRCHQCGQLLIEESDHCRACGARFVPQMAFRDPLPGLERPYEPAGQVDPDQWRADLITAIVTDDAAADRRRRLAAFGSPLPMSLLPAASRAHLESIDGDVLPADHHRRRRSRFSR